MLKKSLSSLVLLIILFFINCQIHAQRELTAEQVYDSVNLSVVMVITKDNDGKERQGSGVVISDGGYIATCNHLIENSKNITVIHQKLEFKNAEIISQDVQKDIAVIKISSGAFSPVKKGNSDKLKPGQKIYTISSPSGYENTITEGIVSGLRKDNVKITMIQSTAPIAEGSSGGALLNSSGELIGIISSGKHEGSLYFAIPVNEVVELYSTNFENESKKKGGGEQ